MQIDLANFLADFGKPFCRLMIEDGWRKEVSVNTAIQYTLPALLELNKNNAVSVLFTPNGNYGTAFVEGESLEGLVTKQSKKYAPYYNALYVDVDIKGTVCKDREELFSFTEETRKELGLEPTWVTKKSGGPHVFWIIDPEDRQKVHELLKPEDFEKIISYLNTQFVGGDDKVAQLTRYMRMPNTYHRKKSNIQKLGSNPLMSKLYQYYDGTIQENFDESKKNYIKYEDMVKLKELSKTVGDVEKDTKKVMKYFTAGLADMVNKISFGDLLAALKSYPRRFLPRKPDEEEHRDKKYHFDLDGNNINLVFEDGSILATSGYKLKQGTGYNRDVSYINNFTSDGSKLIHNNYDRPKGNIYSFLKNYFGSDMKKMLQFLKKEFGIEATNIDINTLNDEDKLFHRGSNKLLCTRNGVDVEELKDLPKGESVLVLKKIFDTPLYPVGYVETNLTEDMMETTELNKLYIFHDTFNNRNVVLKRFNTKAAFNKYINRIGLHCYSDEDTVALMFSILDHSNIPKIENISLNGIYKDFVYLGGKVIHKTEEFDESKYYFSPLFKFDIAENVEQIHPKEFIEKMLECFDEKFVYIPILQYSAMMLMNVWKDNLRIPIYPALLFTGTTGKGKSTIVDVMKSYAGYYGKSREYSLGGRSTSPQPVRQMATDNSIFFLEELTGIVNPATEAAVRGIINRDIGSIGIAAGKNAVYKFKSPILALGQRTFTEDSINNRFVILDMDHQKKRGTQKQLNDMKKYSCYKHIYETYYENPDLIKSLYDKYVEKLVESDLTHRARDVVVFMFIMNDFLDLKIPFDKLLEHVKWHLKNVGLEKPTQDISPEIQFRNVLISGFLKKSIFGTFTEIDDNKKSRYELHFAPEYIEQNRAKIFSSIAFFNEKAKKDGIADPMYMLDNTLVITINDVNAKPVDFVLNMIMQWLVKATKGVFTYVPTL